MPEANSAGPKGKCGKREGWPDKRQLPSNLKTKTKKSWTRGADKTEKKMIRKVRWKTTFMQNTKQYPLCVVNK